MFIYNHNDLESQYFKTFEELIVEYFKICNLKYIKSGQAESDFTKHIQNDGYLIIDHYTGDRDYFIDTNYIIKIYQDLKENKNQDIVPKILLVLDRIIFNYKEKYENT